MAKFVLTFHRGESPEEPSPEVMDRWMAWFGELGSAVVDMGSPLRVLRRLRRTARRAKEAVRTPRRVTPSSRPPTFTMPSCSQRVVPA